MTTTAKLSDNSETYTVDWVAIKSIVPHDKNPRQISPEAIEKVSDSLSLVGWTQPIVVDEDNIILAGHTRLMAAKRLKHSSVPVYVAKGLSEQEKVAYRIADNRSGEESQWDYPMLTEQIKWLSDQGDFDLKFTAFDPHQLSSFLGFREVDALEEWDDMPEFDQDDLRPYKSVLVHFETEKDMESFAKFHSQNITEKTKYIWYPHREKKVHLDKSFTSEP